MSGILFYAHDPGGARAIAPLLPCFDEKLVFARGYALDILPNALTLPDYALLTFKPSFVITGTSGDDFSERHMWKEAARLSIPSMAILDFWVNYGVRFSRYGVSQVHLFDGECDYLPEFICVMDEFAKEEMTKEGVPGERILTFGNPHFEMIASRKTTATPKDSASGKRKILFASQPFEGIYRKDSELIVLETLIDAASKCNDLEIIIRKHPKEPDDKFAAYLNSWIFMDDINDSLDSIQTSELIVSESSMVLIEASFLGKKIISYQPKIKDGQYDFILTKNGSLPPITSSEEFERCFHRLIDQENNYFDNNITCTGIIDHITDFVKERIHG